MARKKTVETVEVKPEEFVRIQSKITITVTAGLQLQDVTNKDAHIPDRLKINPLWPKLSVQIKEGTFNYPVEIVEWPTVKALVRDKILTIGNASEDEITDEEIETKETLEKHEEEVARKSGISLDSLTEE
jgi:hypothetical protein